jgi:hypothetical protein
MIERPGQFVRSRYEGNREQLSPLMEDAYRRAQELFADPAYALQKEDFHETYKREQVEKDARHARELEAVFDSTNDPELRKLKKVADVFEAMVLSNARLSNWFGRASVMKTLPYDDYKNKIDIIGEWQTDDASVSQLLALGVDVTFGAQKIQDKMSLIRQSIDTDTLSSIKYFKDYRNNFVGTRNNVPRCIVGFSQAAVEELAMVWRQKGAVEILRKHSAQRVLLDQMFAQLSAMYKYAVHHKRPTAVRELLQAANLIQKVRSAKPPVSSRDPLFSQDPVDQELRYIAETTFKV